MLTEPQARLVRDVLAIITAMNNGMEAEAQRLVDDLCHFAPHDVIGALIGVARRLTADYAAAIGRPPREVWHAVALDITTATTDPDG